MRTLKICVILGIIFSLAFSSAFAEEQKPGKKYDLRFSLAGGSIKGNFAMAGEFTYARNFGGLFAQVSTMANVSSGIKEYGGSLGLGTQGEVFQFYVFVDSLYREKLWVQLRPMIRLDFNWLSIGGFYALPLENSPLKVGLLTVSTVSATKYFGGEFNLIPTHWLKFYGQLNSIEGLSQSYRVGAEIRPLKFISISADWNKAAGTYSNWNRFRGFQFVLNLLLGAGQNGFRQTKKNGPSIIPPLFPMLIAKDQSGKIIVDDGDGNVTFATNVTITYERLDPYKSTDYFDSHVYLNTLPLDLDQEWQIQNAQMTKNSSKEFSYTVASIPYETKLWMYCQDWGRSDAGGPEFNGRKFIILGTELTESYIRKDPWGNGLDVACFILKKDNTVIPWD